MLEKEAGSEAGASRQVDPALWSQGPKKEEGIMNIEFS
jgi:hypothetical protein